LDESKKKKNRGGSSTGEGPVNEVATRKDGGGEKWKGEGKRKKVSYYYTRGNL